MTMLTVCIIIRQSELRLTEVITLKIHVTELCTQLFLIPGCQLTGLVIIETVLFLLSLIQPGNDDDIAFVIAELRESPIPRMTGKDDTFLINDYWSNVPALTDALNNVGDSCIVDPRIIFRKDGYPSAFFLYIP